jgi:hypothetical protein
MESGIPVLTDKGRKAVQNLQSEVTAKCRNILVQVDGKRTLDDIRAVLKGLDGVEDGITKLVAEEYIQVTRDCRSIVESLINKQLGNKAPMLLRKLEELHARYKDACWDHLGELDKAARLFYGEVVAEKLRAEIAKIVQEAKK